MHLERIIQLKRKQILKIAGKHGIQNLRVFGSVSRGDSGPSSDVDMLVDLGSGRSLLDLGAFMMDMKDLLGRKVDVVTEKGLHSAIRKQVLREARAV